MDSIDEIIMTSRSTREVETRLREQGLDFQNRTELFSLLQKRWGSLKESMREEYDSISSNSDFSLPSELPSLEVSINQQPCKIYGLIHDLAAGEEYLSLIYKTVAQRQYWLMEQYIPSVMFILSAISSTEKIELPDHLAPRSKEKDLLKAYLRGLTTGVALPFALPFVKHLGRRHKQRIKNLVRFTFDPGLEMINALARTDLPYYADLEEKGNGKKATYNPNQQRSAYMAEFLRYWKPEQPRNILTGAAHAAEIRYFIEQGVKEQRIVEMAQEHAEVAENDPLKFAMIVRRSKQRTFTEAQCRGLGFITPYVLLTLYSLT